MKTPKLFTPLFFFLLLVSNLPFVQAQQETMGSANIRFPSYELYAPAKIIVNFVYTNNVTVNVKTLGTSLYKATTSPVQALFEAEAFDVYTITIDINYIVPVNQTIIVGLYEGGRAAKGLEFDVVADHISLMFRISVVEAPRYPTSEELANAMWERLQGSLNEFTVQQQGLIAKMGETIIVVGSIAIIGFLVCVVALISVFYMHRKVAELSEWGIRHETEHRKGAS